MLPICVCCLWFDLWTSLYWYTETDLWLVDPCAHRMDFFFFFSRPYFKRCICFSFMVSFYLWIRLFCLAGQKNSSPLLRAAWWRTTASGQPQNNWWSTHSYETNLTRGRSAFSSRTTLTGQRRSEEKRVSCTFVFQRRKQKAEYYSLLWETALLGHSLGHQCNEITLEAYLHGKK